MQKHTYFFFENSNYDDTMFFFLRKHYFIFCVRYHRRYSRWSQYSHFKIFDLEGPHSRKKLTIFYFHMHVWRCLSEKKRRCQKPQTNIFVLEIVLLFYLIYSTQNQLGVTFLKMYEVQSLSILCSMDSTRSLWHRLRNTLCRWCLRLHCSCLSLKD